MAKQTLGQGDSNVVVRNQVVYGALPQDVIDRMGDTTLALQTTEQNVLPAINELKSNLTKLEVKAKYVTYSVTVPTTYTEYLGSATVNFYNLALNSSADFPTGKNILAIIPQTCSASSGTQRALVDIGAGDLSDPRAYIFGKGNNTYSLTILVLYTEP